MTSVTIKLPLRLVSELNQREHWTVRKKRAGQQRPLVRLMLAKERLWPVELPARVTITRIAPRALDDDNAAGSAKHVRDGVADALGVDDRTNLVVWEVQQRRGKPKEYAVEIRVEGPLP